MNKYECSSCKREVVSPAKADKVEFKCCKGESLVSFKKKGTSIIVPATKIPEVAKEVKVLPASTPATK
jgi:DNA-directed RNA polymerase subunit RPC12/RpoP